MSEQLSGRALDLAVAERVMGFDRLTARIDPMNRDGEPQYYMGYPLGHDFAPVYSQSIEAAMQVVENMREQGWSITLTDDDDRSGDHTWFVEFTKHDAKYFLTGEAADNELPVAICRAALEALRESL